METLCHGAQVVNALSQDNAPAGTTPLEWCQAQSKDQAIHQIIDGIQNKMLRKIKIKDGMPSELKALIRLKRQLVLKHGGSLQKNHTSGYKNPIPISAASSTLQ